MNPVEELVEMLAEARNLELSATSLQALCLLVAGPMKLTDLADELVISTAAVTGIVDRLVNLGFAERRHNHTTPGKDRRVIRLGITHQGVSAVEQIIQAVPA